MSRETVEEMLSGYSPKSWVEMLGVSIVTWGDQNAVGDPQIRVTFDESGSVVDVVFSEMTQEEAEANEEQMKHIMESLKD